jgi:hypothetical protein
MYPDETLVLQPLAISTISYYLSTRLFSRGRLTVHLFLRRRCVPNPLTLGFRRACWQLLSLRQIYATC